MLLGHREGGRGPGPSQRWQKHKNPEALEVYYKVISRSKNICICKLPVSLSGSSNKCK